MLFRAPFFSRNRKKEMRFSEEEKRKPATDFPDFFHSRGAADFGRKHSFMRSCHGIPCCGWRHLRWGLPPRHMGEHIFLRSRFTGETSESQQRDNTMGRLRKYKRIHQVQLCTFAILSSSKSAIFSLSPICAFCPPTLPTTTTTTYNSVVFGIRLFLDTF